MKTICNNIESVKSGKQYTVSGQGAKRHSTAKVTMSDGKTTKVNRDVNKGGNVDGSNSRLKNRVSTADLMIHGASLEEAVFQAYANHGWTTVDGERCPRGRDHAFRISPTDSNMVQTFNVTIDETDHRYGWRDSFSIAKAAPDMMTHEKAKAKAPRRDANTAHRTTGEEWNRNQCMIQLRNEGALKAPKRKS